MTHNLPVSRLFFFWGSHEHKMDSWAQLPVRTLSGGKRGEKQKLTNNRTLCGGNILWRVHWYLIYIYVCVYMWKYGMLLNYVNASYQMVNNLNAYTLYIHYIHVYYIWYWMIWMLIHYVYIVCLYIISDNEWFECWYIIYTLYPCILYLILNDLNADTLYIHYMLVYYIRQWMIWMLICYIYIIFMWIVWDIERFECRYIIYTLYACILEIEWLECRFIKYTLYSCKLHQKCRYIKYTLYSCKLYQKLY